MKTRNFVNNHTRRFVGLFLLAASAVLAQAPAGRTPVSNLEPVGSVNDLMVGVIWPLSDEVFYLSTRATPKTDEEWRLFQGRMLMLAETGNLLMMPGRARDNEKWMQYARRLYNAGFSAFKAAKAKDAAGIADLSNEMYAACVACHNDYRSDYRRRPLTPE
jgi:hypothetical protein